MSLQTRLSALITAVGADIKSLRNTTMLNTKGGSETVAAASGTSGTVTLDLNNASIFTLSPTADVTTLTISNVPASKGVSVRLIVSQGATPRGIAAPSGAAWLAANAPTPVANKITVYDYFTTNGGTTWLASAVNQV